MRYRITPHGRNPPGQIITLGRAAANDLGAGALHFAQRHESRGLFLGVLCLVLGACSAPTSAPPLPTLLPLPSATPSPAVTARAATPVIIATDTPTPTPVTYVVQKGDTLIGIAVKYGVSIEALQAANNNVQPEFLPIGAVLIIPSPEGGPIWVSGLPTPTPVPVTLGAPACYPTAAGALYCFLEARNPGGAPIANVSARITLAGADGMPISSGIAYSALDVIPPGAAAPMALLFSPTPGEVAATGALVLSASPAPAPDSPEARYIWLEVPDYSTTASGAQWTASGQVWNPSGTVVTKGWLTMTLYDASGAILGYRKVPLPGGLAPGATLDFSISATALGGAVNHISLAAEGQP